MPTNAGPRYVMEVFNSRYNEYHIRDTKTMATSDFVGSASRVSAETDLLNLGRKVFHQFAWWMPNEKYVRSRL